MTQRSPDSHRFVWVLAALALGVMSPVSVAQACEPCLVVFDLERTVAQADLIIVGEKIAGGRSTDPAYDQPDWIRVGVTKMIHGQAPGGRDVAVNSWDGMCDFGITLPDGEEHLIFLKQSESAEEPYEYTAVNQGCAVKSLPVKDGQVFYQDEWQDINTLIGRSLYKNIRK